MAQTIEAEVAADGTVRLREPIAGLGKPRRALVVVLDEPPAPATDVQPVDYRQFLSPPVDEWHRKLRELAVPTGVSLPDSAFSSEELYD